MLLANEFPPGAPNLGFLRAVLPISGSYWTEGVPQFQQRLSDDRRVVSNLIFSILSSSVFFLSLFVSLANPLQDHVHERVPHH